MGRDALPPLRYLNAADVRAAMPGMEERLELADLTLRALGREAELPPKIGVHPRADGSLGHAMPALLRGAEDDGSGDLLGMKWIAGFPANLERGLPAYHALVLLNDPRTGVPLGILDGGPITAERTAAVSGAAIRVLGGGRAIGRAALLGAGVQARSHVAMLAHLIPGIALTICDAVPERATALAREVAIVPGIADPSVVATPAEAVRDADLVISVTSFGPHRQALDPAALRPESLFIAVDYDMQATAAQAASSFFAVDERDQFRATRSGAVFAGYRDPDATLGELLRGEGKVPEKGCVLVTHLGVGLADVVFASAVLRRAAELGLGLNLPR